MVTGDYSGTTATNVYVTIHVLATTTSPTTIYSMECYECFYDSYQEVYNGDLTREVAQSAPVREPPYRPRLRHSRPKINAYRRARSRAPDRQWFEPIKANAPPRSG